MTRRDIERLIPLVDAIGRTFGPYCEVVLHDLTKPDHSIVAISNGHVTGRKVGDGPPANDLYRFARSHGPDVLAGYRSHTADGRSLRSTTVFMRDDHGTAHAALGINVELSAIQALEAQLGFLLRDGGYERQAPLTAKTVSHLLRELVAEAIAAVGKAVEQFDRNDRVQFARHLEERGAFTIRDSVPTVARRIGVSRVAMYTYIEEAKRMIERGARDETDEPGEVVAADP